MPLRGIRKGGDGTVNRKRLVFFLQYLHVHHPTLFVPSALSPILPVGPSLWAVLFAFMAFTQSQSTKTLLNFHLHGHAWKTAIIIGRLLSPANFGINPCSPHRLPLSTELVKTAFSTAAPLSWSSRTIRTIRDSRNTSSKWCSKTRLSECVVKGWTCNSWADFICADAFWPDLNWKRSRGTSW